MTLTLDSNNEHEDRREYGQDDDGVWKDWRIDDAVIMILLF